MANGICAVVGCTNSTCRLNVWKKSQCEIHEGMIHKDCPCPPSFRLHTFPSKLRFAAIRDKWIHAINRETKKKRPWQPGTSDVVCSIHFVDGASRLLWPKPRYQLVSGPLAEGKHE